MEFRGIERPARAIDETADAVLLGLRRMVGETVQFLEPERMLLRPLEIEAAGVENALERRFGKIGLDDIGGRD